MVSAFSSRLVVHRILLAGRRSHLVADRRSYLVADRRSRLVVDLRNRLVDLHNHLVVVVLLRSHLDRLGILLLRRLDRHSALLLADFERESFLGRQQKCFELVVKLVGILQGC